MELHSQFIQNDKVIKTHWVEDEPTHNMQSNDHIGGVHAICFYGDKIVVVYAPEKNRWTPPGGGVEPGETYEQATVREIHEESNMNVLYHQYIGYQDATDESGKKLPRQARSFCIVEPFGDFVSDPDNDITEIKLIDPKDYKQYFDWGKVGDRMMTLAMEMKKDFDKK